MQPSLEERFEAGYIPEPMSGCWLWIKASIPSGYGRIMAHGQRMGAHVVSYYLYGKGPIEYGMLVRHTCDTPCCVNPEHLELGTPAQNMADRDRRGRCHNANKTHCIRNHAFNEANTYRDKRGRRHCRACFRIRSGREESRTR